MSVETAYWLSVLAAWAVTIRKGWRMVGRESATGVVFLACCLCFFGPLTILGVLLIPEDPYHEARRRAEVAEQRAREARALSERERLLGMSE